MEISINDFINEIFEEENDEPQETSQTQDMSIKSYDEAERAIWYYKKLQLEIADAKLAAEAYVKEAQKMADRYLQRVCSPLEKRSAFVEQRLRNFADEERQRTGKKSLRLINGTLSFSKQQDKYERDEEEILNFCLSAEQDSNLRQFLKPQNPKLDWASLKKASKVETDDNGTKRLVFEDIVIPGVQVTAQEEVFKVK